MNNDWIADSSIVDSKHSSAVLDNEYYVGIRDNTDVVVNSNPFLAATDNCYLVSSDLPCGLMTASKFRAASGSVYWPAVAFFLLVGVESNPANRLAANSKGKSNTVGTSI